MDFRCPYQKGPFGLDVVTVDATPSAFYRQATYVVMSLSTTAP
jgi:hypothetical protein